MSTAEAVSTNSDSHPAFCVLGVRIDALQIQDVISQMEQWITQRDACRFIAVTNVHVVMEAQHDLSFRRILGTADLCVPDGMPLVWLGQFRGYPLKERVYGPDLLLRFCGDTNSKCVRHFFYGGAAGVPEALASALRSRFPMLVIAGTYSPPFRPLTPEEDASVVAMINRTEADVLWVGLGCPKQERWMYEHRDKLNVPVLVGIGQAFDIHAGRLKQAPIWMRERGLEWLFRLASEPRRLWRRYLILNTKFIVGLIQEAVRRNRDSK